MMEKEEYKMVPHSTPREKVTGRYTDLRNGADVRVKEEDERRWMMRKEEKEEEENKQEE